MTEREELLSEIERVRDKLEKNEQLFDIATESTEIEALIFERKALRLRCSTLYKKAKEYGIKGDESFWQKRR